MKYLIIYFLSISFFLNCYSDSTPSRSNPLDAKGGVGLFVNLFLYNLRYPAPKANTATTSTGTPPSGLSYYELSYKFFLLQPASAGLVNVSGSVTSCTASPALPAGLTLNPSTCEIGGSPTVLQAATLHLITASNSHGGTTTDIRVTVAYPVSGTFSAHANIFLGPLNGYITGWTYWFMWVVTCMAEITAVGVYVTYWLPEVPQWIPALLALLAMTPY